VPCRNSRREAIDQNSKKQEKDGDLSEESKRDEQEKVQKIHRPHHRPNSRSNLSERNATSPPLKSLSSLDADVIVVRGWCPPAQRGLFTWRPRGRQVKLLEALRQPRGSPAAVHGRVSAEVGSPSIFACVRIR